MVVRIWQGDDNKSAYSSLLLYSSYIIWKMVAVAGYGFRILLLHYFLLALVLNRVIKFNNVSAVVLLIPRSSGHYRPQTTTNKCIQIHRESFAAEGTKTLQSVLPLLTQNQPSFGSSHPKHVYALMPPGDLTETFIITPELSRLEKLQIWHLAELNWAETLKAESTSLVFDCIVPEFPNKDWPHQKHL